MIEDYLRYHVIKQACHKLYKCGHHIFIKAKWMHETIQNCPLSIRLACRYDVYSSRYSLINFFNGMCEDHNKHTIDKQVLKKTHFLVEYKYIEMI